MARRPIGWLLAVAAATVVSGCGGGGDDDSGFAEVTNRACEEVTAAAKTLSTDLVRGPGDDEASAVKAAIDRYATTVEAAAKQLKDAKPRKADRAFQQQAVSYLQAQAQDLRAAADGKRKRAAKAVAAAPLVPPALLDGAPACGSAAR